MSCIPGNLDGFLSLDKLLCFRESFVSNNITTFNVTDEIYLISNAAAPATGVQHRYNLIVLSRQEQFYEYFV